MKPVVVLPLEAARLLSRRDGTPSPHAIRRQLAKILTSEAFLRAKRMQRFLQFVVEESLVGRSNQLCEYSIALSVFGRDESFEPGTDPIVRNDARRLRQKLGEYYRQCGLDSDEVVIEIPKGGYRPAFRYGLHPTRKTHQYRLTITLTRISDSAEIWTTAHEY